MIICRAVDMLDLEPHDLACAQSRAIAEAQQQTVLNLSAIASRLLASS
jgi:hypothetical protein